MNAYEAFALDYHLTDFDPNMTFDEVLEALINEDESAIVWAQYEDLPTRDLIDLITGMVFNLENRFTPKQGTP